MFVAIAIAAGHGHFLTPENITEQQVCTCVCVPMDRVYKEKKLMQLCTQGKPLGKHIAIAFKNTTIQFYGEKKVTLGFKYFKCNFT